MKSDLKLHIRECGFVNK